MTILGVQSALGGLRVLGRIGSSRWCDNCIEIPRDSFGGHRLVTDLLDGVTTLSRFRGTSQLRTPFSVTDLPGWGNNLREIWIDSLGGGTPSRITEMCGFLDVGDT